MIQVVNSKYHIPSKTKIDIYIGRGSPLGNPVRINHRTTRDEAIAGFEEHIQTKIREKDKPVCNELNLIWTMAKRGDVNLVCFCKPEGCHGDIIKRLIEEKL